MVKVSRLPKEQLVEDSSTLLVESVVKGIQEKKGHDIAILDLKPTGNALADFFVITHADSSTQVDAIAKSVEAEVEKLTGERPVFKEGYTNAEWILLDYINVVVHVFLREQRDFYGIERFWADADVTKIK